MTVEVNRPEVRGASAAEVVRDDLASICDRLSSELAEMAGKRLLITGGAGFLGYYLVQIPLHWNAISPPEMRIRVTVLDNFSRGAPAWLTALEGNPELAIQRFDIREPLPPSLGNFHYIIHGASIASPIFYRKYPIETMDANVNGLRHLLDAALRQRDEGDPVEGFLFFSTSEIYGDPDAANIPTAETYRGNVSCTGPRACYDESKRYGETLCANFAREYDLPIGVARPFNNYGPGLKITDRRVIPDFARNIFDGEDIVMLSDGAPTRTYCYIADAATGYYKILLRGRPGEAYNIGTEGPEISVFELAERMIAIARDLYGYQGRVIRSSSSDPNYLTDNPNRRCPRIQKAREELSYEPEVPLTEGLTRSLRWYNENRIAENA